MNGVLFINKPENWTSRDVVNKISSIYHTKKVGHTGTLDPMATGVMIVCLGTYTKLVDTFTFKEKTYLATMELGIQTDTGDITGNIIKEGNKNISKEEIIEVFESFPKEYNQTVPKYSAVKINGKKLYEYARENIEVELPTRLVQIYELKIIEINNNKITFETTVSKGTYIRSLIEDIAENLKTVATMTSLVRTKQGSISLDNCLELNEITNETPLQELESLFDYPKVEVNEEDYKKIQNGNKLSLNTEEEIVFITYQNKVIAIYEKASDYRMVFKVV